MASRLVRKRRGTLRPTDESLVAAISLEKTTGPIEPRGRQRLDRWLQWGEQTLRTHSDSPRLDAEVLMQALLGRDRAYFRAWPDRLLAAAEVERYQALILQRVQGTPVAYLTGEREFWSRRFLVTPSVLIPRPETEVLIELALAYLSVIRTPSILDLGTGSGNIAVTLAAERPDARVLATDASRAALAVAKENARYHRTSNVQFLAGNWLSAFPERPLFDLVVSNPPYIAENDRHLAIGDLRFEPLPALVSGTVGEDALRVIARDARSRLRPGGLLLLEHGYDQAESLRRELSGLGYSGIESALDLQGLARVIGGRRPP